MRSGAGTQARRAVTALSRKRRFPILVKRRPRTDNEHPQDGKNWRLWVDDATQRKVIFFRLVCAFDCAGNARAQRDQSGSVAPKWKEGGEKKWVPPSSFFIVLRTITDRRGMICTTKALHFRIQNTWWEGGNKWGGILIFARFRAGRL